MKQLSVIEQLVVIKTMVGIKLFTFTVDFNTDTVIAVCKMKPALRYILNADGTDMVLTDRKIGIEVLDMVTVQEDAEFVAAVGKTKQLVKP